jgi:uncharacterized protein (DUF885 family)
MVRAVRRVVFALLLLLLLSCGRPAETPARGPATQALHALFDEAWERALLEDPVWASSQGDMRHADRWTDIGLAAIERRHAYDQAMLQRIDRIDRAQLSKEDALSYDLFRYDLVTALAEHPFGLYLLAVNQRGGIQTADEIADALPFETPKHFADYNARLRAFPSHMDQTIALLGEGIRRGITHPKIVMQRVLGQIDKQIVTDATKSPFFDPYLKKPREPYASEARAIILSTVVPAFQKMRTFWAEKYLPACKDGVGAWQLPEGGKLYAHLVRSHTTTKLSPDEVHAIGLREVARIRGEMETIKAATGFGGSLKEFFVFLRTDPRFFYPDGAALLSGYRDLAKRIDPLLVKAFKRLPRTPYGVQAIPEHIAPDTTTAYYREPAADGSRAGTYFVNLYKPEARPKREMTALTLHEAVPGHHLQIAIAMEQENLPKFRRHEGYTAFVEGWALYAESLGAEMGVYDDPYAKFGQLAYEMWRAVRLVVDTGIHHLKWDRQRAIDFFLENAPKPELDVVNEIDRYIAWPGQALAYKIGELRIKELRKKTQRELTLKDFHDLVLSNGPLPLDILEREVMGGKR